MGESVAGCALPHSPHTGWVRGECRRELRGTGPSVAFLLHGGGLGWLSVTSRFLSRW